jgi:FPC/CPF motif-containing protein YcgG
VQPQSNQVEPFLPDDEIKSRFAAFVADAAFPCLGAKAASNAGSDIVSIYDSLASAQSLRCLAGELEDFLHSEVRRTSNYATFVAIFREPQSLGEEEFEQLLWSQLQQLHQIDTARYGWDRSVASDPSDPHFSFSFAGQALYVVGLHGGSSRHARRFPWPTLVFNPHEQFERLRLDGKWGRIQEAIRSRDIALQGSANPMLSEFGERSEARQYSGRRVDETWKAPFRASLPPDGDNDESRCPFHR